MNKYKKLASNTIVFAIGSMGAKIFSLLLNNLYTKNISPADFFVKNLLETTALFLLPVFSLSLTEAVIRFGLDRHYNNKKVFSTAFFMTTAGMLLMALVVPFLKDIPFFSATGGYTVFLVMYIIASSFRSLCGHFVQSRGRIKLYALDGIFTTLNLFIFSVIFISALKMGVKGFMLSSILADTLSAMFLFSVARLRVYLSIKNFSFPLGKEMLKFTAPLIPTIMMWSITELSDQIFIGNMHSDRVFLGESASGLYSASAKLPALLSMFSTIFFKAWNISAISENDSKDREKFYGTVYRAYEGAMFLVSTLLIIFIKPLSAILINSKTYPEYSTAYLYSPLLISGAVFNCLNQFLFGIYTASKNTVNAFVTSFITCIANLILNTLLIAWLGIQGAAIATYISYVICYIIRISDTRKYIQFKVNLRRTVINTIIITLMSIIVISEMKKPYILLGFLFVYILLVNYRSIILTIKKFLRKK